MEHQFKPWPAAFIVEACNNYERVKAELNELANHILAMHDDAYLVGHPEWNCIVDQARAALAKHD